MSKKTKKEKTPYPIDGKVKIRQSYYTFAREFPSRILPLEGKRRKGRKKRIAKNCFLTLSFVALLCFSYFTVNLLLDISYRDIESLRAETTESITSVTEGNEDDTEIIAQNSIKALYMPSEKIGDKEYIKSLIRTIRARNGNSVIIDFKTDEGKLIFSSMNDYAIKAKCALFDNNTVRQAVDLFEEKDINVIARIYCFEDNAVASANGELAVKYMNTDINWRDGSNEEGGRSYLNPYSAQARDYLKSIVEQTLTFKIDGIILESVSFPSGEHISGATYPGETKKAARNTVLKDFVSDIKEILPEGCTLLLAQSTEDIISGSKELYHGSMLDCDTDGFVIDTKERKDNFIIDKKTEYVSMFSLFSSLKEKTGTKTAVYRIDSSEYSAHYLRKMDKAGYGNFIIYSEDGTY